MTAYQAQLLADVARARDEARRMELGCRGASCHRHPCRCNRLVDALREAIAGDVPPDELATLILRGDRP